MARKISPEDWNQRYSSNWSSVSRTARRQLNDRCCHCWWRRSTQLHHAAYVFRRAGKLVTVAADERSQVGHKLFPLCDRCHDLAHTKQNWVKHPINPVWGNCNTPAFTHTLFARYWVLFGLQRWGWIFFLFGLGVAFSIAL